MTREKLPISVAGITFLLDIPELEVRKAVEKRFEGYVGEPVFGDFSERERIFIEVDLKISYTKVRNYRSFIQKRREERLWEYQRLGKKYLEKYYPRLENGRGFRGDEVNGSSFRWDGNRKVEIVSIDYGIGNKSHLSILDKVLFGVLTNFLVLNEKGLVLHSAAVEFRGDGILFAGVSGAGKTTVVKNSVGKRYFSDENAILRWDRDNSVWVFGSPFYGSWRRVGHNIAAPVRTIFSLKKSKYFSINELSLREKMKFLYKVFRCYSMNGVILKAAESKLERLSQLVRELHLPPTPELWDFLEKNLQ